MKIGIIGTGYVGLPTGVGLAELGNEVVCIDQIESKINDLNHGKLTIFEDGLEELFIRNRQNGRLNFTLSMEKGIHDADVVLIAVGTPPDPETKKADMKYIYAAAQELAPFLNGYTVIAIKSTVPVGTGDQVEEIIRQKNPEADFDVISLPEFLREGFAIHDFFNPDRIVVGTNSARAQDVMAKLYAPFAPKTKMLFVKRRSSETIKYASNAFLAMKIHYINEMADFCEKAGADIYEVAQGLGADDRIGPKFLRTGPGYGGSCFPKDTNAMAYMAHAFGVELSLVEATIRGNDKRKQLMAENVWTEAQKISNPQIAILGAAFKGGTDDCRESPALDIIKHLLEHPVQIRLYDPKALNNARKILGDAVYYAQDAYDAVQKADILLVLTEWEEFKSLDLAQIKQQMKGRLIFDMRGIFNPQEATQLGFDMRRLGIKSTAL